MSKYRIGQLNVRIIIYRPQTAPDGGGGYEQLSPVEHNNCWAYKRDISQKEAVKNDQLQADLSCVFVIRNHPTKKITQDMYVVYAAKTYSIIACSAQEKTDPYVEITCTVRPEPTA